MNNTIIYSHLTIYFTFYFIFKFLMFSKLKKNIVLDFKSNNFAIINEILRLQIRLDTLRTHEN